MVRGSTDYLFSIIMDDVDRCSVRSNQDGKTPTGKCAAHYGSNVSSCCGQAGKGTISPHFQCPYSKPNCVNYVANQKLGTCGSPPNVQVKNDTPYAVTQAQYVQLKKKIHRTL